MKIKALSKNLMAVAFLTAVSLKGGTNLELPGRMRSNMANGLSFTENKGQVHNQWNEDRKDVLFGASNNGLGVHLTSTGVSYQLYRVEGWNAIPTNTDAKAQKKIKQASIYRLDLQWIHTNPAKTVVGNHSLPGTTNYILNDGNTVRALSYGEVVYQNIYKGVDLKWYEKNHDLEYDFIVKPGGDYRQIAFSIEGAKKISVSKANELILETPFGKIVQKAPVAFQAGNILPATWKVDGKVIRFDVQNVNPALELVIDPVVRVWGTYYGGSNDDRGWNCATDASGNVYMSGDVSNSTGTIIATSGSHQSTIGGSYDAFLVKFNSAGVRQWATFYGASGNEFEPEVAVDPAGNVYMASYTDAGTTTVIATAGSHQSSSGGGVNDAFLVKFDANGIRQWATYYGGTGLDFPRNLCTDASGNVYMVGQTSSAGGTNIASTGAHQPSLSGLFEGFLVKFNGAGVRQWGTYYGGTSDDRVYGVSVDGSGNVYISGDSYSTGSGVISTTGSHQVNLGGSADAFLCKFNSSGVRQWATYYGGTGDESESVCTTDINGNVFMIGTTSSAGGTVIATAGSHQSAFGGGARDAYIASFDANGVRQWGTYYGGTGTDWVHACTMDPSKMIYFSGYSNSTGTVIATPNGFQPANNGGNDDFFACFNAQGKRFYGTFYGGSGNEDCGRESIAVGGGYVYLSGLTTTGTSTVIASSGAHQTALGGSNDGFLAKFQVDGEALSFDATSPGDWVVLPAALGTALSNTNKITVEVWVRPTSLSGLGCIIGNYSTPNNQMQFLLRRGTSNYQWWVGNTSSGYQSVNSVAVPSLNIWQHVAGVYDGTVASIYVNGVLSATAPISYATFGVPSNSIVIGGNTISENFNGDIDEVRVWNRPLCIAEIVNNINGELPLPQPGLIAYYRFNQGISAANNSTVTTLLDASPSAYTGTLSGITLNGYTSNWISPGAVLPGGTVTAFASPTVAINGPSVVCSGTSVTLTAVGNTSTFAWASGPTTATRVVVPTVNTTYSVIGTNSLGCVSGAAIINMTVNSTPTISISGGAAICSGNSATLTASGSLSTYTWVSGPGTASNVVTPTGTTTYSVSGTSSLGCVSNQATVSLVVNATPTITVSGSNSVCSGKSATLQASGSLSTYTWVSGPSTSSNVVTPSVNTTYSVSGTSSAGCISNQATISLSVFTTPTISASNGTICSGKSFTLNPSGASTYTFAGGNAVVSPTSSTTYTVIGSSSVGCVSANTATIALQVNANPTVTAVSGFTGVLCSGQSVTLTASGASTYSWDNGSSTGNIAVSPTITTTYTVTGTDANGCQSNASVTQSVSSCVGLNESNSNVLGVSLYPNPTNGKITLAGDANINITVMDVLGKTALSMNTTESNQEIDLSACAQGVYLVKCESNGKSVTFRLIKQ